MYLCLFRSESGQTQKISEHIYDGMEQMEKTVVIANILYCACCYMFSGANVVNC